MIGREIKQRREELGLSRESLAGMAGLSLRTIDRIEAGESVPQRSTLRVIELAFETAEQTEAAA